MSTRHPAKSAQPVGLATARTVGPPRPTRRPRAKRLARSSTLLALMAIVSFATLYPAFFTLNAALKTHGAWIDDRFALSISPTRSQLDDAWQRSAVPRSFLNSVVVTVGGVVGAWVVCSLAAYAATKMRFRGRNAIFVFLLASMMIPMQTILYPFFVLMRDLGWINEYHGLIVSFVTFAIPITTFQMAAYFKSIPNDLIDASKLDGATSRQTLVSIVLPIARPVLATTGIINCVWMWNDLLLPLMVMQRPERQTLIVSLGLLRGQYGAEPTLIAAGVVIGIAPVALAYLVAQEYLIKGMTHGAVK